MTNERSGANAHLYDVAVVGAGPAGSATATHLARAGLDVALVDRATFPRDKPCAEYLSPAVEPLLANLGALAAVEATHPARLRGFRVFAPDGRMFQGDFAGVRGDDSTANGTSSAFETGLAVPRTILDAALVDAARDAGAEARENWRLSAINWDATKRAWRLSATRAGGEESISARILIGADGVHSLVARRLGLRLEARTRKIAIVAHLRGIEGLSEYGEMHVANRRYVGIAPMEPPSDTARCNVAMVVDERREGRALAGKPQEYLLEALSTFPRLRGRVGALTVVRPALTASRLSSRVRRRSAEAALLVGDAAGYYDPFTGEGIYHALRSAQIASSVIVEALAAGDVSASAFNRYDRMSAAAFRGKRTVELAVQAAVQSPALMSHIAARLEKRKSLADTLVAVTGDYLSPAAVLRPGYLLRLAL
ncbi:MAG TPA: FAD-dependent oxidoreductase [Ktedonobacterales bacterium]|nr:FAD-dependent oxidoreductase [Ktedonobacterales bacterium]